jgi:hypothetical protein
MIRLKSTGQVMQEGEFRSLFPNTSLPPQLTETIINDLGGDVVFEGPQPTGGEFWQYSQPSGVEQKNGKWYTKHIFGPVFDNDTEKQAYIAQKTTERNTAIQLAIVDAVQNRLNEFAKTRNYDGILSACTYATSAVPKFKTEGQYCVEARDTTWAALYNILEAVKANTRPVPTGYSDIEADLPVLTWP